MAWKREVRTWLAITGVLVLWASAFAGIRAGLRLSPSDAVGADGYGPGELALLRFGTASTVLALYALAKRMRMPERTELPLIGLTGFLGISVYHVALEELERNKQCHRAGCRASEPRRLRFQRSGTP